MFLDDRILLVANADGDGVCVGDDSDYFRFVHRVFGDVLPRNRLSHWYRSLFDMLCLKILACIRAVERLNRRITSLNGMVL